jgi:hypothetical protein
VKAAALVALALAVVAGCGGSVVGTGSPGGSGTSGGSSVGSGSSAPTGAAGSSDRVAGGTAHGCFARVTAPSGEVWEAQCSDDAGTCRCTRGGQDAGTCSNPLGCYGVPQGAPNVCCPPPG